MQPRRTSYLLASIPCITCLTKPQSRPRNISPNHFCSRYPYNKVFESCDFRPDSHGCNRIQSLEKSAPGNPLQIHQDDLNGALLFGENRTLKRRACERDIRISQVGALELLRAPQQPLIELNIMLARIADDSATRQRAITLPSTQYQVDPDTTSTSAEPSRALRGTHFDTQLNADDSDRSSDENEDEDGPHYEHTPVLTISSQPSSLANPLAITATQRGMQFTGDKKTLLR